MKLNRLIPCNEEIEIEKITDDSRTVGKNILFVCVEGLTVDGHKYAPKAVENGAVAIVCRHKIEGLSVPQIVVEDTQKAMNEMLNRFYGDPQGKMRMIGVTGTDGKTTTSEMMYQILNGLSHHTGYIGTNGIRSNNYEQENDYTTPLQSELFQALNGFLKDGVEYVSMEATGERLGTGKMAGVNFDASIFTNLTRDALDIFKTMENYGAAKAKLMEYTKPDGTCVINLDDPYAKLFIEKAKHGCHVVLSETSAINDGDVKITSREKLSVLAEELKDEGFGIPHSSYLVNIKRITSISNDEIILEGEQRISVSRSCKENFHHEFSKFFSKKYRRG